MAYFNLTYNFSVSDGNVTSLMDSSSNDSNINSDGEPVWHSRMREVSRALTLGNADGNLIQERTS